MWLGIFEILEIFHDSRSSLLNFCSRRCASFNNFVSFDFMQNYLIKVDFMQVVINLIRLSFSFSTDLSESNERCLSLVST